MPEGYNTLIFPFAPQACKSGITELDKAWRELATLHNFLCKASIDQICQWTLAMNSGLPITPLPKVSGVLQVHDKAPGCSTAFWQVKGLNCYMYVLNYRWTSMSLDHAPSLPFVLRLPLHTRYLATPCCV